MWADSTNHMCVCADIIFNHDTYAPLKMRSDSDVVYTRTLTWFTLQLLQLDTPLHVFLLYVIEYNKGCY